MGFEGRHVSAALMPAPEPMLLPVTDGHLFVVRHRYAGSLRARVLLCPPILQEHTRSYRFFAQLAEQWARRGVEVMRFDYRGTGDSSGASLTFNPARAIDDIRSAWTALITNAANVPRIICGVRLGSLLAAHALEQGLPADGAWWWQTVFSGAQYLDELEAIDRRERASRGRFPMTPAPAAAPGELMGFTLDPGCLRDIRAMRWPDIATPSLHVTDLPPTLQGWTDQVDFEAILPIKLAMPISDRLLATLDGGSR